MGGTAVVGGGMALGALGQYLTGSSQADANKNNLAAQQQQQQYMQNMVQQYIGPPGTQNPYAQQMMQFIGQGLPATQYGTPAQGGGGQPYNPGTPPGTSGGSGGGAGTPGQGEAGGPGAGGSDPYHDAPDLYMNFAQGGAPALQQQALGSQYMNYIQGGPVMNSVAMRSPGPANDVGSGGFIPFTPPTYDPNGVNPVTPQGPAPTQQQGTPGSGMYNYNNPGAFTYNPQQLGQAPQIGGLPMVNASQVFAPTAQAGTNFQPGQVQAPLMQAAQANFNPNLQAQQIGGMPQMNAQQVNPGSLQAPQQVQAGQLGAPQQVAATGTQGFNSGQDALMQMMTRNLTPTQDPTAQLNLQQIGQGQGTLYNTSDLFKSIQDQGQMNLNDQVAQLQGSSGSLGQRFGSAEALAEGRLRQNYLTNTNAQEQQIGLQSFQNQQAMRQPALDSLANMQNQQNQLGLQGYQAQGNMASQLGQLGQAGTQMNLQAQLANQQAGMQGGQFNIQSALQAALANQGAGLQAGTTNLNAQMQAALANQGAGLQAGQGNLNAALGVATANQGAGLQAGMQNQSLAAQLAQYNASNQQQGGQMNQAAMLQAALANQNSGLQAGLSGQSLAAQLAQFNAGQGLQSSQLNSQYGLQSQQSNQQAALQAALANQSMQGQYATNNANIYNQAGQFNAQMGQSQSQFAAGQGNIYNNLILQTMAQAAGLQGQTNSQNAGLIGLLNGVGVPQQQASPWGSTLGNIGNQAMMIPFLNQLLSGSKPTGTTTNTSGGSGGYDPGAYGF